MPFKITMGAYAEHAQIIIPEQAEYENNLDFIAIM